MSDPALPDPFAPAPPAPVPAPDPRQIEAAATRLFGLLPAWLRLRDGDSAAAGGGDHALRAFAGVLASGLAEVDAGLDGLYDALFVETAPEAALQDFAALIGAVALIPLPDPTQGPSLRGYIANAIRHRRGKGTARVLEELARDVTGHAAVVVEYFQRLAVTQALIDPRPERPGLALLTAGDSAARAGSGFDTMPRLADLRSIARAGGRHHVHHVGLHLTRLLAPPYPAPSDDGQPVPPAALNRVPVMRGWPVGDAVPPGHFQLAAIPGEIAPLMNPDRALSGRTTAEGLADRLHRLPLEHETAELRRAALEGRAPSLPDRRWFTGEGAPFTLFLRRAGEVDFTRVPPAAIRIANLEEPPPSRPRPLWPHHWYTSAAPDQPHSADHPILVAFDPLTGRAVTPAPAVDAPEVEEIRLAHAIGTGAETGAGPQDRNTRDLPFDITEALGPLSSAPAGAEHWFLRVVDPSEPETGAAADRHRRVRNLARALAEYGAEGAGRRGLIVLARNDISSGSGTLGLRLHPGQELTLVAADWRVPRAVAGLDPLAGAGVQRLGYLVRKESRHTIDQTLRVIAAAAAETEAEADIAAGPATAASPAQPPGRLVLDGLEFTRGITLAPDAASAVTLRHCTLRAQRGPALKVIAALAGMEITLDRCRAGTIMLDPGAMMTGGLPARSYPARPGLAHLVIRASVVAAEGGWPAVQAESADADLCDVTLLGPAFFHSLSATNAIFDAPVSCIRRQSGCLRYSWIAPGSTTPRRFRCQPELAESLAPDGDDPSVLRLRLRPRFLGRALGDPTLALLAATAPPEILSGGEDGAEMGAHAARAFGIRRANMLAQFADFLPFGLEAAVIDDTLTETAARRRIRP